MKSEKLEKHSCKICNKCYASASSLCNHNKKFHKTETNNSSLNVTKNVVDVNDNSKNVVENVVDKIDDKSVETTIKKIIRCEFCKKIFASRFTKSEHKRKACKFKDNINIETNEINETNEKIKNLENTVLELKELIQKNLLLQPKINKQKINNNTNNTNNINNNSNNTTI